MLLSEIVKALGEAEVSGPVEEVEITGITEDSREAGAGSLFVALPGEHVDGHDYVEEALQRGSVAVITEREIDLRGAVAIRVSDGRTALARAAARFYGYPCRALDLVGITGTNGKTTVSLLLQGILRAAGRKCGLVGTLRYEIGDETFPAPHTTPDARRLQSLLHDMVARGAEACVMEVSSHALSQDRVGECRFDVRVFTNLSRDHLDFHGSMEAYYAAKRRLFGEGLAKAGAVSVINVDDPWGERLARECHGPVLTFGLEAEADVGVADLETSIHGLGFTLRAPSGEIEIRSPLIGRYNVSNVLTAATAALALEIPGTEIRRGIAGVQGIPGRFEKIPGPGFLVVVDYAHTDDALRSLLENARPLCRGRLITVFGCGGDRDRGKRPLMGRAAARLSDEVIVTSDNPRSEDPEGIIAEILEGIPEVSHPRVIPDRSEAIHAAIREARAGDMVVVAGKGHEDYQILGGKKIHFDDREVAREALRKRP